MRPGCGSSFRLEVHRRSVHAIALSGRTWAIVEHVTQMAAAFAAMYFGTHHEEATILRNADRTFQRLEKARPAGAAFELRVRHEQVLATAAADEFAAPLLLTERACAGAFGAMLAQHRILRGRQLRAPFLVSVRDGIGFRLQLVRCAEQSFHQSCLRFGFCDWLEDRMPGGNWGGQTNAPTS